MIAACSSFLLRQSVIKIPSRTAAFKSSPLRVMETAALSSLEVVKPSRELAISFSQALDSSHFAPASSTTYTQMRKEQGVVRKQASAGFNRSPTSPSS